MPADPQLGTTHAGPALDVAPLEFPYVPVHQAAEAAVDPQHRVPTVQTEAHRCPGGGVHARREPADVEQGDPGGPVLHPPAGQRMGQGVENVDHLGVAVAAHHQGAVVVLGGDAVGQLAGLRDALHQRHRGDPVELHADQLRNALRCGGQDLVNGRVSQQRTHRPVEGTGHTASLHVPENGHPGVLTELFFEHLAHVFAGDGLVVRVVRALGHYHDAVAAPGRAPVLQHLAQVLLPAGVRRPLRDQHVGGIAGDGAHQGQPAAVPAHHLDHKAALVALRRRPDRVDGLHDAMQRRIGADGQVGADHVVVDRAHQTRDHQPRVSVGGLPVDRAVDEQFLDQRRPLLAQQIRPGQAAVAADHDKSVDASLEQMLDGA